MSAALDRIESATTDLISGKGVQHVRIGSLPSLADYWLIPRLAGFIQENPTIKLHVVTLDLDFSAPGRSPNLQGGRIDLGLFYGDGHWDGLKSVKLMSERLVPVVSPEWLKTSTAKDVCADEVLESLPLLRHSTRPESWEEWFRSKQVEPRLPDGPAFEHFHMLVNAAKAGIGVALVPLEFVRAELESKRLKRVGAHELISERAYYLIFDPANEHVSSHKTFRTWVEEQASKCR